jgi:hypothetical protein
MSRERYRSARENLLLSLQMYKENLNARYLLEQVDLELSLMQSAAAKK